MSLSWIAPLSEKRLFIEGSRAQQQLLYLLGNPKFADDQSIDPKRAVENGPAQGCTCVAGVSAAARRLYQGVHDHAEEAELGPA